MGWYSDVRKRVRLDHVGLVTIHPRVVFCQYNPELCRAWLQCADGYRLEESPHFLAACNVTDAWRYEKYCIALGHSRPMISRRFLQMADMIQNGIHTPPDILETPLVVNEFNPNGHEIWEGHHRMAAALARDEPIPCNFYRWRIV